MRTLFILLVLCASAQAETFRNSSGQIIGRSSTTNAGTTFYNPAGQITGRKAGDTFYNPMGQQTGRSTRK